MNLGCGGGVSLSCVSALLRRSNFLFLDKSEVKSDG